MNVNPIEGTWIEGGQRFRYEGRVIRTLATGKIKLAYGDDRLRELREARDREAAAPSESSASWKNLFGGLLVTRERALEH